jgi:hypothetical protein
MMTFVLVAILTANVSVVLGRYGSMAECLAAKGQVEQSHLLRHTFTEVICLQTHPH